jgi:hypothetical protein
MIALIAAAIAASAAAPPLRAELEPMRFLVGHCWRGPMKQGAEQDVHCFEPVFDGQHIRDRHEVTGGAAIYRGETLYSWNGAAKRIDYVYWNSLGGVSRGSMEPKRDLFDFGGETYVGADGRRVSISTVWRRIDALSYEARTVSTANPTGDRIVRFTRID